MLFDAIVGGVGQAPGPGNDFWYEPIAISSTGVRVTPLSAMRASACYAAVNILAETIASIPFTVYERENERVVRRRLQHPLQDVIDAEPNPDQTAFEFWHMQVAFGALFGTAYALIVPGQRGAIDQLIPMRPDRMQVERLDNGRLRYKYRDPIDEKEKVYTQDDIWRIPGFSFDGVQGIAPIVFANDAIGLALAAEAFGGKFFKNDATPSVALKHPKPLKPEAHENIRNSWRRAHQGLDNKFSVAILEEGMELQTIGISNKDSQFIEARKYQISEIARYFRIPPHMLGDLDKSSFNNIEQQSIEFVKYTIRPHLKKIEQRVRKDLIINKNRFFVRGDLDDLLRGEIQPRYQAYSTAISSGFMTRNEAREKEDMNPLPGLDEPLQPMNMGGANDAAINGLLSDASQRIVASEMQNVSKYCAKSDQVGLDEYYNGKFTEYATKTLSPVYDACRKLSVKMRKPSDIVLSYITKRSTEMKGSDDMIATLNTWNAASDSENFHNFTFMEANK